MEPAANAQTETSAAQGWTVLIGPRCDTYLRRFAGLERRRFPWSWNWPAFLFGAAWLLYRRLWWHALAFVALIFAAALAECVVMDHLHYGADGGFVHAVHGLSPAIAATAVAAIFPLGLLATTGYYGPPLAHLLLGVFANALYRSDLQRRLSKTGAPTRQGVSRLAVWALVLILGPLFFVATSMWYGSELYGLRHKTLPHLILEAKESKDRIGAFVEREGRLPRSLQEAEVPPWEGSSRRSYDAATGALRFELTRPPYEGRLIVLTPKRAGRGIEEWTCSSPNIPDMMLGGYCRGGYQLR